MQPLLVRNGRGGRLVGRRALASLLAVSGGMLVSSSDRAGTFSWFDQVPGVNLMIRTLWFLILVAGSMTGYARGDEPPAYDRKEDVIYARKL